MTRCEKCGKEYGACDVAVHETIIHEIDPKYTFDMDAPIETPFYEASESPRLTEPYKNGDGVTVAQVATVLYLSA